MRFYYRFSSHRSIINTVQQWSMVQPNLRLNTLQARSHMIKRSLRGSVRAQSLCKRDDLGSDASCSAAAPVGDYRSSEWVA